jgi:hypothetical protein
MIISEIGDFETICVNAKVVVTIGAVTPIQNQLRLIVSRLYYQA